jgi:competence protein ComEA
MSPRSRETSKSDEASRPRWSRALWRRSDQLAAAALTLLGLVGMLAYWLAQGGAQGRLLDVERPRRLEYAFQVDINRAEWPELAQLPGIGITLAQRIVERRDTVGPFQDHDQLLEVRGIGPKTLEAIRPYLLPLVDPSNVAARDAGEPPSSAIP